MKDGYEKTSSPISTGSFLYLFSNKSFAFHAVPATMALFLTNPPMSNFYSTITIREAVQLFCIAKRLNRPAKNYYLRAIKFYIAQ